MAEGTEVARAIVAIIPKSDGTSNEVISAIVDPIKDSVAKSADEAAGLFNSNFAKIIGKFAAPAAIGAAFVGAGKYAYEAFNEVDAGLDNLSIATGATGEQADKLAAVYKNVARSVVGDFGDIGSAVGELNTRLGVNDEALESASESAMKYAAVTGQDATKAIQDVTKMMNNAGIPADQYGATLDKLTVAGQQAGVDVGKLAQTVNSNAASFKELGFSTDEAIAMLAQFDKSGADTSGILAGMKKGVQNWAKEGKSAKDGFADFVKGVENGSVTSADAIELFGSKAGITMFDAAQKGQLAFGDMLKAIEGSAGALDSVYEGTLDAPDKLALAMQNVKLAAADAAGPLMGLAADVLDGVVIPAIQNVSQNAGAFMANVQAWYDTYVAPVVDEAMTVITPILNTIIAAVMSGIQSIGSIMNAVMPQVQQLIADIWPDIQSIITTTMGIIQAVVGPVWTFVQNHIGTVMNGVKVVISTVWTIITTVIKTSVSTIKSVINGISSIISGVKSTFETVKNAMTQPIQTAKETISGILDTIKGFFPINIGRIFDNLQLPHISVSGGEAPFGIGGKGSLPHFSVDWYARAMTQPYIFEQPTIFGAGEAGTEIMYGRNALMRDIREAVHGANVLDADSIVNGLSTIAAGAGGAGGDVYVTLYAYPGGPQMDQQIVRSYDRGKRHGLK